MNLLSAWYEGARVNSVGEKRNWRTETLCDPLFSFSSNPAVGNIRFADVVSSVYRDGDHVWVHDYQLMQVPHELRRMHPNCRVAWFLHTPFPSSEIYRILPVRKPLLQVSKRKMLVGCLVGQVIGQLVGQSVGRLVGRLVGQLISHLSERSNQ